MLIELERVGVQVVEDGNFEVYFIQKPVRSAG